MEKRRVVSVSLGSCRRDKLATAELLGYEITLERRGTDGDMKRAAELISQLDGQVDAIGLGGIDLYIWIGRHRYTIRDALKLARAAQRTPVVDGSGLKHTLEREAVGWLAAHPEALPKPLGEMSALLVSGADRWGMAEALSQHCRAVTFGDLMFTLGIPIPLRSLTALYRVGRVLAPIVVRLPFSMLYPTGKKQQEITPKYTSHFMAADLIAGDFHYIRKYLPDRLPGKVILTNTTTEGDRRLLAERGVSTLVTTTPVIDGRSFGTNLLEAAFVAIGGPEKAGDLAFYRKLMSELNYAPSVQRLDHGG